jgi:hypothetical protein
MNKTAGIVTGIGVSLLLVGNAFGAPIPPPPTPVGCELWPYATTGVVLGLGAWKMLKK